MAGSLARPALSPSELVRVVRYVLRPPALLLHTAECPDVTVLARGRVLGLVLRHHHQLTGWQRGRIPVLRAGGMLVWLVDSVGDAFGALDDFGCSLRPWDLGSGHVES